MKYLFLILVVASQLASGTVGATEIWKSKTASIEIESDGSGEISVAGDIIKLGPGGWRKTFYQFQAVGTLPGSGLTVLIDGYVFHSGNITFEYLGQPHYLEKGN